MRNVADFKGIRAGVGTDGFMTTGAGSTNSCRRRGTITAANLDTIEGG
jgi:hypothetical protein